METPFETLHAAFPPASEREAYDPARHDAFSARVPDELADEWRSAGFGAYGDGVIWLPAPDKPVLERGDWPFLDGTGIEVLHTAFGNVCVWQGEKFLWLNEHTGKVTKFPPDAVVFFEFALTEDGFRKEVLMEPLFKKARSKLGALGADEVYGFAPLPALGGAIDEKYLIKTDLREYVALAGQMLKK